MKAIWTAKRACKNLWHAKTRTILTSLAIAISAFALTLSIAAGEGVRQYANGLLIEQVDTKALLVSKDMRALEISNPALAEPKEYNPKAYNAAYGSFARLDNDDVRKLKNIDGVDQVTLSYSNSPAYVTTPGSKKYMVATREYSGNRKTRIIAGTLPPLGESIAYNETVMPESFLSELGFSDAESAIGKFVTIRHDKFKKKGNKSDVRDVLLRIIAVSERPSSAFDSNPHFKISLQLSKDIAQFQTEGTEIADKYYLALLYPDSEMPFDELKESVKGLGYKALTPKENADSGFELVNMFQVVTLTFSAVALIVSVFGVINTQYISVLERTQQIGLMKALGMRNRHVARLFRYEAALIGLLGGLIGVASAWIAAIVLNPLLPQILSYDASLSIFVFKWLPSIGLIFALMFIAIIAGYLPARKATKVDPIEALRTE